MHVAGHMCDMVIINDITKNYDLLIVVDTAKAYCGSLNEKRKGTFSQSPE